MSVKLFLLDFYTNGLFINQAEQEVLPPHCCRPLKYLGWS